MICLYSYLFKIYVLLTKLLKMSNFKHSFFRTLLYAQLLSGFSGVAIAAQIIVVGKG